MAKNPQIVSKPERIHVKELEAALLNARLACARFKSNVPYAGNLYDAAEDVIYACEQMEKEARNA